MSQNAEKCQDCRYFEHPTDTDDSYGRCRRWAPRPETQPVSTHKASSSHGRFWPAVLTTDWCGEFEPALAPRSPGPRR